MHRSHISDSPGYSPCKVGRLRATSSRLCSWDSTCRAAFWAIYSTEEASALDLRLSMMLYFCSRLLLLLLLRLRLRLRLRQPRSRLQYQHHFRCCSRCQRQRHRHFLHESELREIANPGLALNKLGLLVIWEENSGRFVTGLSLESRSRLWCSCDDLHKYVYV